MARVLVFDTTLRDGEQSPGATMTPSEKLRMAHQLDALGVDIIEAGFAISSPDDFAAIRQIAGEVRRPVIAALARANRADVERAGAALEQAERGRIHTFIATSAIHLTHKLRIGQAECIDRAVAAIQQARTYTDDVEFSAEDATRTDIDFLCRIVQAAIEAGATTINIPDTVGYAHPEDIRAIFAPWFATVRARPRDRFPRALPRRPGPGGGELAGGDRGRGAAGGVHDQRHRRARGQTRRWKRS
jgi:2-isopropylmalate synthase